MRICLSVVLLVALLCSAQSSAPVVESSRGLTAITFAAPQGSATVNLPDDMQPGDTISGSMDYEARGATVEERSKNLATLRSLIVSVAGEKRSSTPFTLKIPPVSGSEIKPIRVALVNAGGAEVAATDVIPAAIAQVMATQGYALPSMGQQGWPVVITGAFDGDSSNTEITIGGKPARTLAESPRQSTFESPADNTGAHELAVKENGHEMRGPYRNASVRLSAAKAALTKGERTTLTAKVEGLDGMSTPALLRLTAAGPVRMEGGNEQTRMIFPNEVKDDGSFTLSRSITALQAGGFNVNGRVNLLGVCLHDDKDGHSLYFSQDTGAYMFCPKKGDSRSGAGAVNLSQCEISLDDTRADRKLHAVAHRCDNNGSADLEFDSRKFSIRDRDLKNNVCGCK